MNLYNGNITVKQILSVPQARELLKKELPQLADSPLLNLAGGMTLNQVLTMAKGYLPREQVDSLLERLKAI